MKAMIRTLSLPALAIVFALGCGHSPTDPQSATTDDNATQTASSQESGGMHDHSGWWCNEHGIPEEICSMGNSKVAAEFQKKGDWCKEHDRAESQCFICHPELKSKFAAQYEAKYGKQPPKPEG